MSLKIELEKLAEECETCAGKDETSLDEHLENCPACLDQTKKAEEMGQMIETMHMLASKPEEERQKILGARMNQFSNIPDDQRIDAITDMLDSLEELSEGERHRIVKTRTDIITKIPKEQRMKLLGSMKQIMTTWPNERKMMEQRAIMTATEDYFPLKRMMVRKMFRKMMS